MKFESYLQKKHLSVITIQLYTSRVCYYQSFCKEQFGWWPQELLPEHVQSFLIYLQGKAFGRNATGLRPETINAYLAALKQYNYYLIQEGVQSDLIITEELQQHVQKRRRSPVQFNASEVNRFLQTILQNKDREKKYRHRDYALANLLALAGLRISEALDLEMKDVIFESNEIVVRKGKGTKYRTALMNEELKQMMRRYVKQTRPLFPNKSEAFFCNRSGKKLHRKTVNRAFTVYSREAALQRDLSPHDLRHHFCSMAIRRGLGIHEVAGLVGHESIQTTMLYTHPTRQELITKLNQMTQREREANVYGSTDE